MSITFLLTSLVVVLLPGAGALYVVSTGLSRGVRAALLAAVACTLGTLPHLALAVTGVAALLQALPAVMTALRVAGCGYLLYLAWATFREHGPGSLGSLEAPTGPPPSSVRVIRTGVGLNLLNPKLTTFFVAFLPQFVPAGTPSPGLAMLTLGAVFVALTAVVFAGYGLVAALARRRVVVSPRLGRSLKNVAACSFVLVGLNLALAGR